MTARWTVLHSEPTHIQSLEKRGRAFLAAVRASLKDTTKFERADADWQAFQALSRAVVAFAEVTADPMPMLQAVSDESGRLLAPYYSLNVGPWKSYYWVDPVERLCVGVLIAHESDTALAELGRALADALAQFKRPAKD